jgi:SAM-dependent methyltransferase
MLGSAPRPAVVGDACGLPFASASLDVVIAGLVLSFVSDLEATLREATRVLRPGGTFLASDLHSAASERGWQRSFTGKGGERLVIDAPPPARARVEACLRAAGLTLQEVVEPAIDARLLGAFERAGRRDFESLRGTPLLQIFRARKGGTDAR